MDEKDAYYSYAPLSHVFEQIGHLDAVMFGFKIGYTSGDQDAFLKDIQNL